MGFTEISSRAMRAIEPSRNIVTVFPTERAAFSLFPSPTARPIVTVDPIARPTSITVSMCMTWEPMETAVMLAVPLNWPIMNRSAMPYSVCRKKDSM